MIRITMKQIEYPTDLREMVSAFFPTHKVVVETGDELRDAPAIHLDLEGERLCIEVALPEGQRGEVYFVKKDSPLLRGAKNYRKQLFKRELYLLLSSLTNKVFAWGTLTGVRPVKIVHDLQQKGYTEEEVRKILRDLYCVSADKSKLMIEIADVQRPFLFPLDEKRYSLYINIPFCPTKCGYCSFPTVCVSTVDNEIRERYIDVLLEEMAVSSELMKGRVLRSVYVGGGTPTALTCRQLERVLEGVHRYFPTESVTEFTVEAGRPDTLDREMLIMLRGLGVDRISINPQSMRQETLVAIGRHHSVAEVIKKYKIAQEIGFRSVNMDMILGLPGETRSDAINTLRTLLSLEPENLTIHTLSLKRGSRFMEEGTVELLKTGRGLSDLVEESLDAVVASGYQPYYMYRQKYMLENQENIGYAKPGFECIYNMGMMEETESIVGVGMSATSKVFFPEENRLERIYNYRNLRDYIEKKEITFEKKRRDFVKLNEIK